MTWTLVYASSAARAIKRLDPAVRRRMLAALHLQLALRGLRSWRTRDHRIIYRIIESRIEILVIAVGHRRDVYERLKKKLDAGH